MLLARFDELKHNCGSKASEVDCPLPSGDSPRKFIHVGPGRRCAKSSKLSLPPVLCGAGASKHQSDPRA